IITADMANDAVAIYRHVEHSKFQRVGLTGNSDAATVVPVDLDEDGDEDVVVAGQDDNSIFWYDNDGSFEFTKRTLATNLQTVFSVSVVDIDNDNDFDFVAGDHFRGTVTWYERTRAKPVATAPDNIQQTVDGSGRVTFDSTVSDADKDPTKLRIQYSTDGSHWHKPWLLNVTTSAGSTDLRNSNAYQAGTRNALDTDAHSSVKTTFLWDTKSVENTGGPIIGDVGTVQLRVIPHDGIGVGATSTSSTFRVDNSAPKGLSGLRIDSISTEEATFSWHPPTDSSVFSYTLYYGTDHAAVLEQRSEVWDFNDDPALKDIEATSTTVTGLSANKTYTFKLFVQDIYGNISAAPSVQGVTAELTPTPLTSPTPTPSPGTSPVPSPTPGTTPSPLASPTPVPTFTPLISPSPSIAPSPTPSIDRFPSTIQDNTPPIADAGINQAVHPSALVILDGTASYDADGDALSYVWRQLSGPKVELVSNRTATPSFSAGEENETYIFALTVKDTPGAIATDTVTVATKALSQSITTPVEVREKTEEEPMTVAEPFLLAFLRPLDIALFATALLNTLISVAERVVRSLRDRQSAVMLVPQRQTSKGKV
ncbi:MAG: PKD domain-containing protein, partial [Candidatus Binatia bacterium]